MLRWILGGREAQSSVQKSPVLCIGEEQPKNCFTELQVLKGHFDIVRFLVQIDDFRFASAGDDGLVLVWNVECEEFRTGVMQLIDIFTLHNIPEVFRQDFSPVTTGERLQELRGHTQQITAITAFPCGDGFTSLITASSDRSLSLWDPDTGNRVQTISDLQSSVKCLLVLGRLSAWLSGGEELCVWDKHFQLLCHRQKHSDTGIAALVELPKNCVAAAVDKEIVIYRVTVSSDSSVLLDEISRCSEHHDQIRALINVNDGIFASGSHAGELILWDSANFRNVAYEHILWEEPHPGSQTEIRLAAPKPSEMSIQHLTSDGRLILAAVGSGLYVYDVVAKAVVAYRKAAHDSNVLHATLLSDGELMSCSEDGSVRMWEIQDLPLAAEPASAGFFGMWTFGRSSKQPGPQSKKVLEIPNLRTLELTGDLIGHSGAVQMFLSFREKGLVTCSTDHLLILWKDGERQSRLRSQALFQKLEENGGL